MLKTKLKNTPKLKILSSLFLVFFTFLVIPIKIFAQTNSLEVDPSLVKIDLSSDKPVFTITYTNNTSTSIELNFSLSDINKNTSNFQYGLSTWLTFNTSSTIILPQKKALLTVTINKEELPPGSHYGEILASVTTNQKSSNLNITPELATLVLVRNSTGREVESGKVTNFTPNSYLFSFPASASFRVENTGNVDLTPYGVIEVKNIIGDTLVKGIINKNSLIVLPQSLRYFTVPLNQSSSFILPSIYNLTGVISLGQKEININTYFFSLGSISLSEVLALPFLVLLIIIFIKRKRR